MSAFPEEAFELTVGMWCAARVQENARTGRTETDDEVFAHVAGTEAFRTLLHAADAEVPERTPEEEAQLHIAALAAARDGGGEDHTSKTERQGNCGEEVGDGGAPPPDVLYAIKGVDYQMDGETLVAGGSLVVFADSVELTGPSAGGDGKERYAFTFPQILLHAICREGVERPSVYMQVEGAEDGGNGDAAPPSEVYLIPRDAGVVDKIFTALCAGAELNPGIGGADDGDDGNGGEMMWFNGAHDMASEDGAPIDEAAVMERLAAFDSLLVPSPAIVEGQFDNAE
jgi:hypothetical protein